MPYSDLFYQLMTQPGTTVITVNQRLSRYLLTHYATRQTQDTWTTPDIIPLDNWLDRNIIQAKTLDSFSSQTLLTHHQTRLLLENIIQNSYAWHEHDIAAIATLILQALQLITDYHIPNTLLLQHATYKQRQCIEWITALRQMASDRNALLPCDRYRVVIERIKQGNSRLNQSIIFVGFDDITPIQTQLALTLKTAGIKVNHFKHTSNKTQNPQKIAFANPHDEMYAMARWAKDIHDQDPNAFIGCIVPDLTHCRDQLQFLLDDICNPTAYLPGFPNKNPIYTLSSGKVLHNHVIIQSALNWLELLHTPLNTTKWQQLLRSPYFHSDPYQNAELIEKLNEIPGSTFSLDDISTYINSDHPLQTRLTTLTNLHINVNEEKTPDEWINVFRSILSTVGWPGDRLLSSEEHQLVTKFYKCFDDFLQLAFIFPELNYQQSVFHLKRLCLEKLFQPKSTSNRIQVLGVLEASSLPFTHAWFLHCDMNQWPLSAKPNPFIPIHVQRQYQLPHSSSERELQFAETIFSTLTHAIPHFYASYAIQNQDQVQLPSPLLQTFQTSTLTVNPPNKPEYQCIQLDDRHGSPLNQATFPGGSQLFTDFNACSFRAYLKHRLQANAYSKKTIGFTPLQRGQCIHKALELAWNNLKNHANLIALSDTKREHLIQQWAKYALYAIGKQTPLPQSQTLISLELNRLTYLLNEWLRYETTRPDFTVIALESARLLTLNNKTLRLKFDRLDQLSNHSFCVIDYKTGNVNSQMWFGERPDQPQLPLYCLTSEQCIDHLAFAQIKHNALAFITLSSDDLHNTNNKIDESLRQSWQATFSKQAIDISEGCADINPKYGSKTCQLCDLKTICRIEEQV